MFNVLIIILIDKRIFATKSDKIFSTLHRNLRSQVKDVHSIMCWQILFYLIRLKKKKKCYEENVVLFKSGLGAQPQILTM